ncbi:hypothetical protein E8D34_08480 [Nocardioides sp. GY 10113]|nr:hypothetical protein E8D34_08480 [Nocardioides sp. GY 10113]
MKLTSPGGLRALRDQLAALQEPLASLRAAARTEFSTELDAVDAALSDLGDSIGTAVASPSRDNLTAVRDSADGVTSAVQDLATAVKAAC